MRLIFLYITCLFTILASAVQAQQIGIKDPLLGRVSPVVFCVDPYPEQDPDNPGAVIWTFPNDRVAVLSDNDRVPASLGTAFGLEVQAAGPDRLTDVTVVIEHPEMADGTTRTDWVASYPSGRFGYSFFGFGFPEERVAGEWAFSLIYEDRVLYQYVFSVAKPDAATQTYRFCE